MHRLLSLVARFRSDERGAFLVIFGVLAIVLVATSGAVVDYTTIEQARTRAQVALDTASLGLQPRIYNTSTADLQLEAQNLLVQQLGAASGQPWSVCAAKAVAPCAQIELLSVDTTEGTIHIAARISVPTPFVSLLGIPQVTAGVVSEATRKKLNLEVAMVLDNSGSMSKYSRMDNLKVAAKCATKILFGGACDDPDSTESNAVNVKLGIVPFTEFVNVGTANKTASWMDESGVSDIANDNFDEDDNSSTPFAGPLSRFGLFDQFTNVSWAGCVEARKPPYDTDDTVPSSGTPDTLFVPAFAPDEPDVGGFPNNYMNDTGSCSAGPATCTAVETRTQCSKASNCSGTSSTSYSNTPPPSTGSNCTAGLTLYSTSSTCTANCGTWNNKTYTITRKYTDLRVRQERSCKYSGAVDLSKDGPNADCPANALLPLTENKADVLTKIDDMIASGGTNIHQGTIWGYHMLSPTEPLIEGEEYGGANSKVLIIMTDGENTHNYSSNMNGAGWYVAYSYPYNGRLTGASDTALQTEMNVRTLASCTSAKAPKTVASGGGGSSTEPGITIYTIGLNPPNQATRDLLTSCATDSSKAFFPTDATELTSVFETIANQLSNLRLAK